MTSTDISNLKRTHLLQGCSYIFLPKGIIIQVANSTFGAIYEPEEGIFFNPWQSSEPTYLPFEIVQKHRTPHEEKIFETINKHKDKDILALSIGETSFSYVINDSSLGLVNLDYFLDMDPENPNTWIEEWND